MFPYPPSFRDGLLMAIAAKVSNFQRIIDSLKIKTRGLPLSTWRTIINFIFSNAFCYGKFGFWNCFIMKVCRRFIFTVFASPWFLSLRHFGFCLVVILVFVLASIRLCIGVLIPAFQFLHFRWLQFLTRRRHRCPSFHPRLRRPRLRRCRRRGRRQWRQQIQPRGRLTGKFRRSGEVDSSESAGDGVGQSVARRGVITPAHEGFAHSLDWFKKETSKSVVVSRFSLIVITSAHERLAHSIKVDRFSRPVTIWSSGTLFCRFFLSIPRCWKNLPLSLKITSDFGFVFEVDAVFIKRRLWVGVDWFLWFRVVWRRWRGSTVEGNVRRFFIWGRFRRRILSSIPFIHLFFFLREIRDCSMWGFFVSSD